MYDCMKPYGKLFLKNIKWSFNMCIEFIQFSEINLCLCYLWYFLIKIAVIKKKSNLFDLILTRNLSLPNNTYSLKENINICFSISWFPIKSYLMLIACVLCLSIYWLSRGILRMQVIDERENTFGKIKECSWEKYCLISHWTCVCLKNQFCCCFSKVYMCLFFLTRSLIDGC